MCLFNFRELSGNNTQYNKSYYVENSLFGDDLFFKIRTHQQTYKEEMKTVSRKRHYFSGTVFNTWLLGV